MQFVTVRHEGSTRAGRIEGDEIVLLDATDVGHLLRRGIKTVAEAVVIPRGGSELAPVVLTPDKIICVGKNYRAHSKEMGGPQPEYPTYFPKYARALIGPRDPIALPSRSVSTRVDWEGELAVVIGRSIRHASADEALAAVAGYTICNDVSMRDWQRRTSQFLAGKTFERATPLGPALVTADEVGDATGLELRTEVDGIVKQAANTSDMVFSVVDIICDLSTILTLDPGDVIATGTPEGVGDARDPQEYLGENSVVRVAIEGLGEILNRCVGDEN